jgi:hypothetical protein
LTRAVVAAGLGLVFWVLLGAIVTTWYDRRGLYRIQPDLAEYIRRSARAYMEQRGDVPAHPGAETGSADAPADDGGPT